MLDRESRAVPVRFGVRPGAPVVQDDGGPTLVVPHAVSFLRPGEAGRRRRGPAVGRAGAGPTGSDPHRRRTRQRSTAVPAFLRGGGPYGAGSSGTFCMICPACVLNFAPSAVKSVPEIATPHRHHDQHHHQCSYELAHRTFSFGLTSHRMSGWSQDTGREPGPLGLDVTPGVVDAGRPALATAPAATSDGTMLRTQILRAAGVSGRCVTVLLLVSTAGGPLLRPPAPMGPSPARGQDHRSRSHVGGDRTPGPPRRGHGGPARTPAPCWSSWTPRGRCCDPTRADGPASPAPRRRSTPWCARSRPPPPWDSGSSAPGARPGDRGRRAPTHGC